MMDRSVGAALLRARNTAMHQAASARVPECGSFAAIAQDLDWACLELGIGGMTFTHKEPPTHDEGLQEWIAGVIESMGASGHESPAIAAFVRSAIPGSEPPGALHD